MWTDICTDHVPFENYYIPLGCAYKKGICAMCGKKILDVKDYLQSSV